MTSFIGVDVGCHPSITGFYRTNGSQVIMCGPVQYAMLKAHIDNQHRNWRRVKREVNKAAKAARRKLHDPS